MKPLSIVLIINLAFFAIWALIFTQMVNRPEYIPLFTTFQAAFNLLGTGLFFLDKKRNIMMAFLIGLCLTSALSAGGYILLGKYSHLIQVEDQRIR